MNPALIDQSVLDLRSDSDELIFLVGDAIQKLQQLQTKKEFFSGTALALINTIQAAYYHLEEDLEAMTRRLHHDTFSEVDIIEVYESLRKKELDLRNLQGLLGSAITASDWQSPSFNASMDQQAGRQTGKISAA